MKDELAVNELLLAAHGVAEGGVGQAVDLAQGALGELMQRGEGVVGVSPLRKVEGGLIKKVERRDASRWVPVRW